MKKRILAMLLVLAMLISLCAYGDESSSKTQTPNDGNSSEKVGNEIATDIIPEPTENPNLVEFDEPIEIMDNEYFKLELLRFWQKEEGYHTMDNGHGSVWKIEEGTCYGVDFRIYNKSQSEYRINPEIYIADESVLCKNDINGHPFDAPAPGKNSLMQMTIIRWDGMKEAPIDLSEFNQLNGSIRLGSGVEATYYFSIADCLEAGGPVANEELDDKTIKLDTPVVLADNNYCRMELVSFWKFNGGWHATGSSSWGKGSKYTSPSFGVDIQFYNKSQSEYDIHADAYIGNELVICHLEIGDNSWDAPAPGKNAVMKMTVARWDGEKEVPVSIEELYQLNGTIRISGGGVNQRISFSVPNAIETIG